jgi:DNA-binding transcriptional ArsR family regulator
MVEYTLGIDTIFAALADPVRRDILERANETELTVNQIALEYDMSLAAVSKHIKILSEAGLVRKRRQGRFQFVSTAPGSMQDAMDFMGLFDVTDLRPRFDNTTRKDGNGE